MFNVINKNTKQVYATYPHREQCETWCVLNKLVMDGFADFAGDKNSRRLANHIEIKEV